ncbi:hypothetical protein PACTADRAFT_50636 [Pachysolen tannophilus NRRL Y-2460]|uniref:ABC transporter domain-containing protein n=1 Tax=Pachysolen tannophilus NRRL Y-2460 TaxID=669874 RepID=A0A1E4TSP6_PACTA|nr:hypothetical protein PACTADRAFT_50636 [Pachysolen tannophilus NRRL Y-2460]
MDGLKKVYGNYSGLILSRSIVNFYYGKRNIILKSFYLLLLVYTVIGSTSKREDKNSHYKETKNGLVKEGKSVSESENKRTRNVGIIKKSSLLKLILSIISVNKFGYIKANSVLGVLALEIFLLISRAFLTLKVASLDGVLVSALVSKKYKKFFSNLLFWMALGVPASLTNSLLAFSEKILSKNIRTNLTKNLLNDYLPDDDKSTLYKLLNRTSTTNDALSRSQNHDSKQENLTLINDPNQRITTDVEKFSNSLASLPSQLLKPSLDLLLCANRLATAGKNSAEGVVFLGLIIHLSTILLKSITPNFIKLSRKGNELENNFHMFHSKIAHNSEEIALTRGHRRELDLIDIAYYELEKFKRLELRRLAFYDLMMNFIVKYFWGASGLVLCSIPIFSQKLTGVKVDTDYISANFITNRRLLLSASGSLGRLIHSKKNVQNLIGYTAKIIEFQTVLDEINSEKRIEHKINSYEGVTSFVDEHKKSNFKALFDYITTPFEILRPVLKASTPTFLSNSESSSGARASSLEEKEQPLISGPRIFYGDEITFDRIPLITPSGNLLVKDLSFSIKAKDNLLIIGPNGCGKSSLFRILGGLWTVEEPGKLTIPYNKKDLFYLPQRAYLTMGTLKEQIIYPDSIEMFNAGIEKAMKSPDSIKIVKDEKYLVQLLKVVHLEHLVDDCLTLIKQNNQYSESNLIDNDVSASLDLPRKWSDVLSGGEQQRLALARLFYHEPKFAVLDECTSSISPELEQECYEYAIYHLNITVLSVCHRTSLWKFHNHLLKFDHDESNNVVGTVKFTKFDPITRLKYYNEKLENDKELKDLENISRRLDDLKKIQDDQRSLSSLSLMDMQSSSIASENKSIEGKRNVIG